jgi:hypothetical protein
LTTNQEYRQTRYRSIAGVTSGTYNENLLAAAQAATGLTNLTINGAEIALLQAITGSTVTNINGLRAAAAALYGVGSWDQVGAQLPSFVLGLNTGRSTLPSSVTFTRASSQVYLDSSGVLQSASTNVPAFDYNSSGNLLGLTLEGAATQLLTAPLDFSNAAWTKDAGVTVSAGAAIAPNGTTMDEITFPASSSNTVYSNTSMVTATPHVASVFLKQSDAGGRYVQIAGRTTGFGTTPYVNLDLQTGTLGNGAGTAYSVVAYPNGVYRLYFISTTTGAATNNGGIVINVVDSLTALRFSSRTAAGKIYAWAANLVASSVLTSPILTLPQLLASPDDFSSYWSNAATLTGTHTLTDNSVANELRSNQIVSIATTNQNWVLQAHIEKDNDETRFPQITAYLYGGTAADTCYCHINTKTGAVTKSDSSGGASTVSSADGGDYWIVWITINNAHANTGADISLWPAAGTVFGTRSVAATGSAVFRYVNFVASSVLTSPVLTLATTATRAAPVATVPTSAFNFNTSEGSMFMRALRFGKRTYGQNIVSIDDGTGNNRITVDFSGAFAGPRVTVITGGVNVGAISSSLESVGSFVNIAVGWAENDIVLYVDGVSIGADTSLTLPTVTTLRFGALGSSATNLDGIVSGYVYYPKRLPNTELQGLTA